MKLSEVFGLRMKLECVFMNCSRIFCMNYQWLVSYLALFLPTIDTCTMHSIQKDLPTYLISTLLLKIWLNLTKERETNYRVNKKGATASLFKIICPLLSKIQKTYWPKIQNKIIANKLIYYHPLTSHTMNNFQKR